MIPQEAPADRKQMDVIYKQVCDIVKDIERERKLAVQNAWPIVSAANTAARDKRRAFIAKWRELCAQFLEKCPAAGIPKDTVVIDDETLIPEELTTRVVSTEAVLARLQAGQDVPGARLERTYVSPWKEIKE